jgi:hypothetical protein
VFGFDGRTLPDFDRFAFNSSHNDVFEVIDDSFPT